MTRQEFLKQINDYGIDLNKLNIVLDELCGFEGAHGIYQKDEQWFYYKADGRNHIDIKELNDENTAFEKMFKTVFLDLDSKRYLTKLIDENIAKISKNTVCGYIKRIYSLSDKRAEESWEYLKRDMRVLFEFKYYVINTEFVPEKYCYKVQGYSAEQLYKMTYLNALGAYNYLVYLREDPKNALSDLKAGLPKK